MNFWIEGFRGPAVCARYVASLCFAIGISIGLLHAQGLNGTIVGTLTDQAGANVPNATITLSNDATGFRRTAVSSDSGQYVAYSIPTGIYTLTVAQPGFETLVRTGVEVTAAATLTVDLKLLLGDVKQTLEVNAAAPLVQDQSATVSSLITNRQILEMPLNGRTFTSLVLLSPGAYAGSANNLTTSPYAMRGSTNISVNGSSPQNNSYLIDGIFNRNLWLSTLIMVPTVDSIQEFRVLTSNYSAEYGAAAGAITVVQTKSGTNEYHGSAYEFLRNDKLDANTFFNNRQGIARPGFRRNEFGATTGGPIRKDKTFFFADYQGIRLRQPQTFTSTVPTVALRNMVSTGDFSGLGAPIYDPITLHNDPTGAPVRNQFSENQIPLSRLDPAAVRLINLLPVPTSPRATQNFVFNPVQSQDTDQFDVRVDQNLSNGDHLFGKYSFDNSNLTSPGLLPSPPNPGVSIGPYVSANGVATASSVPLRNQSGTFNYTHVFSPTTVNEARVGVVRWNQRIEPLGNAFNTATELGIPGININDHSGGLPAFTITGYQVIGDNSTFPETSQSTSFQYEDVVTMTRGSHTLKIGGFFIRHRLNVFSAFPTRGQYGFNGQFTRQIGSSTAQTALADFALGATNSVTRNILTGPVGLRFWNTSGFADDTWRVNDRLTWNFGLRYELLAPPYEVYDRWSNFNVATGQILLAGKNGNGRRLRNLDTNNLAPRTGITYALTSDRKTIFRSGFGIAYVEAGQGGGQLYKNLPYYFSQVVATDQNGTPPLSISNGLPIPVAPDPNNAQALSSGNPNAWDFNLQSTRVMQWSAGIERELTSSLLLDVAYVGTRTAGLISNYNYNQSLPGPGAQASRRPLYLINPRVTDVTYRSNYATSKYHSLQVKVEKRYSVGLTGTMAYTYSKYMSDGGNINGGGNGPPQNARCFACEWGPMPEDLRHILVVNHVYELPFGPNRKYLTSGWLSQIAGNWNVSGVWTMATGDHFTPTLGTSVSNSAGGGGDRPNRIADGNLSSNQRSIDGWFDLAAFAPAAQYTFGNTGRGILVGPGNFNVDLGIHRDFPIHERFRLTYRWEMFNSFNRANFSDPNAVIGSAQAGQISGTAPARTMQMALKLVF
jgi:outer membrane receptor protein involved in Fe transport